MATTVISFKFRDAKNNTRSEAFHFNEGQVNTVAEAQGVVDDFTDMLNNVSGVTVIGASVEFPLTPSVDAVGAVAGYSVNTGATLSFYNSAGRAQSIYIPGVLDSQFSGKTVNEEAAEMAALIAGIIAGTGIAGGFQQTDENSLDLVAYRAGKISNRKS